MMVLRFTMGFILFGSDFMIWTRVLFYLLVRWRGDNGQTTNCKFEKKLRLFINSSHRLKATRFLLIINDLYDKKIKKKFNT